MQPIAPSASRSHPKATTLWRTPSAHDNQPQAPVSPRGYTYAGERIDARTAPTLWGISVHCWPAYIQLCSSTYIHPPTFIHLQNHFSDLQTSCQNHASDLHTFCFTTQVHKSATLSHALIGPNRRRWPWLCHWPPKRLEE